MNKINLEKSNESLIEQIKKYIPERLLIYKSRTQSSNYPYSVTRIRAMKVKLIKKEEYLRFLNLNTEDIIKKIEELEYKKDIDELSRIYKGITLIEHSLNRNMADSFQKILRITEGEPHDLIASYLKIYDIWNIKTILRGKINNISLDEILESLVTAGSLRYTLLSQIANLKLDKIIEWLKQTEYKNIFENFNKDKNLLSSIENKLDKYYHKTLFYSIGYPLTLDSIHFDAFIRREIDIQNIGTLIRLKTQDENLNEVEKQKNKNYIFDLMIENGLELDIEKLRTFVKLPYDKLIEELKNTCYGTNTQSFIIKNNKIDINNIENKLLKYNLEKTTIYSHQSIISIIPILEYIIYKKNEIRNLRIILRGKSSNLNNETIKQQLVII